MLKRPDLFDVLKVVRERPGTMTYVYRNILDREGFPGLQTSTVLRRLKHLERLGKVERVRSGYVVQICWGPTAEVVSDPANATRGIPA